MNEDTRSKLPGLAVGLPATGGVLEFNKDTKTFYALPSASTTTATCPAGTTLPAGFQFILDNTNGSGTMTVTPTGQSAITVTTGKTFLCIAGASGTIKKIDLAS